MGRLENLPYVLEAYSHGDLSRAAAAQFGTARAGDASEGRADDIHLRVSQIDVIGDIGEGGAGFQFDLFGQVERLVQPERKIDRAGTGDDAYASIADASDGGVVSGRVDADAAVSRHARRQAWVDKGVHIKPLIARRV